MYVVLPISVSAFIFLVKIILLIILPISFAWHLHVSASNAMKVALNLHYSTMIVGLNVIQVTLLSLENVNLAQVNV